MKFSFLSRATALGTALLISSGCVHTVVPEKREVKASAPVLPEPKLSSEVCSTEKEEELIKFAESIKLRIIDPAVHSRNQLLVAIETRDRLLKELGVKEVGLQPDGVSYVSCTYAPEKLTSEALREIALRNAKALIQQSRAAFERVSAKAVFDQTGVYCILSKIIGPTI